MTESDGYLSRDRARINRFQRERRERLVRIDYMPSEEAQRIITAKKGPYYPLCTHSGILDAILLEWADLTGINYRHLWESPTSISSSGICRPLRAYANNFGEPSQPWAKEWLAKQETRKSTKRVICGARRRRDGKTCQAKSEPGKLRCKWHGGKSTGPRTADGKARAIANLVQNRKTSEPLAS